MKKLNKNQIEKVAVEIKKVVEKMSDFSDGDLVHSIAFYGYKIECLNDLILNGYDEVYEFEKLLKTLSVCD